METINQAPLFDKRSAEYVLGAIMHQPYIIYNDGDKYILTVDDFSDKLYRIIFGAIYNLAYSGVTNISPTDIELLLKTEHPTQYTIFNENKGFEIVTLAHEITTECDMAKFTIQYNRLKKLSALRELRSKGVNIDDIYADNNAPIPDEEKIEKFNKMTVVDILNHVRDKIQLVENKTVSKQEDSGQSAAKGIKNLLKEFKTKPEIGIPLDGTLVNYATRGARKGKMYLYSAPSGGGKTRTMVGHACSMAFPHIDGNKLYIPEKLNPVLFIATEMQADEIQTLILSYISGVNEEKLLMNDLTPEEERLLMIAANIMEKYENNFIIESIANPSIQGLKSLITNYILHDGIEYIFYDYIFTSVGLINEFNSAGLREDVVLMMLSNTLKEIAANYNVFVMSGTQLNGSWEGKAIRNANMLRGSKAIADKIDVGMIGVRAPQEELQPVETYCKEMCLPMPNIVIDIYKNRRGKMCDVKIFRKFDYGTCRTQDIVITSNSTYSVIDDVVKIDCPCTWEGLTEYEHRE